MRDKGFDFEWYDKYCENLFAKGHKKKREHYDVVTAFELFEHLPDPVQELQQIMDLGDNIVFSTQLVPKDVGRVSDWWYFSTRTGQHVSFYTANSLEFLANKNGKKYYNVGAGLHLFTTQKVSKWLLKLCVRRPGLVNKVMNRIHRRKSLIGEDYYKITGQRI